MAIRTIDVVQVSIIGIAAGQAIVNVLHYEPATLAPDFTATIVQCVTAVRAEWRARVIPHLNDTYTALLYKGVVIKGSIALPPLPEEPNRRQLVIGDVADVLGSGVGDTGAEASDPHPTYVAATVRKFTGQGGKRKKGSARLGTIGEAMTEAANQNKLTAAAQVAFGTAAVFFTTIVATGVAGDTLVPVVWSKTALFQLPQPTVGVTGSTTQVIAAILNVYVGSQVSRKQRPLFGE